MTKEAYFEELSHALRRRELLPRPEQDGQLPVEWDSRILCRIDGNGIVRYNPGQVDTGKAEAALAQAAETAGTVLEYMSLMEAAPPLKAQGLTGDFRKLTEFDGTVLAGQQTGYGVHFVTWDWTFDRTGLNQGNYFQENYEGAKEDFAVRSGLISKTRLFTPEQLTELYRATEYLLAEGPEPDDRQLKAIQEARLQIEHAVPDLTMRLEQGQSQGPQLEL